MRQITEKPTGELIPYAKNSRTHSEQQIQQVAASIREFGFTNPVLIDDQDSIIAGHGRVMAAQLLGLPVVPCIVLDGLTETQKQAYIIADNKLALNAGWDEDMLRLELLDLQAADFNIDLTGFSTAELDGLLVEQTEEGNTDPDVIPDPPVEPVTVVGDVWILGSHRVMCGDSTSVDAVEQLMNGEIATLLHADPPYGMGKEGDGVAGDNVYHESLDAFQLEWWATFRTFISDNASAYIWGTAQDLWRLWYGGQNIARTDDSRGAAPTLGLNITERMTFRNEITWDKESAIGQKSNTHRQYPTATERCLFFMLGSQNFGNINTEDFWEGFEPFRAYLEGEVLKMKWTQQDIMDMCGVGMYGHWFTKSQWTLIPEKHYATLQEYAKGEAFTKSYADLKSGRDSAKSGGEHLDAKHSFDALRAFFDNTHENMMDVWRFPKVTGDERHGHATPKPVAMMERVMKSSLPPGGLCVEPFNGSGSTLMGAERTGRRCYAMELLPPHVDMTITRWQNFAGKEAILESDGRTFAAVKGERKGGE